MRRGRKKKNNQKRNSIILGLVLIFLMTFSILGYGLGGNNDPAAGPEDISFESSGYKFAAVQNANGIFYVTTADGKLTESSPQIWFRNTPSAVSDIPVAEDLAKNILQPGSLILVTPPLATDGSYSEDTSLFDFFATEVTGFTPRAVQRGTSKDTIYNEYPYVNCSMASPDNIVLMAESGDEPSIDKISDDCYTMTASGLDILAVRDRLVYITLGINEES